MAGKRRMKVDGSGASPGASMAMEVDGPTDGADNGAEGSQPKGPKEEMDAEADISKAPKMSGGSQAGPTAEISMKVKKEEEVVGMPKVKYLL